MTPVPVWNFFFQAEDGIRDVERSRGLGDVYKRQLLDKDGRTSIPSVGALTPDHKVHLLHSDPPP